LKEIQEDQRRLTSLEGDALIEMFKVNEAGFVKRKEMDVHRLVPIFGLTLPKNSDNDAFNVLYGENLVRHLERNVNCEHNLKNDYLTKIMSKNGKAFYRYF
jgi:hypothetical protein